jgi:hypothetical protein
MPRELPPIVGITDVFRIDNNQVICRSKYVLQECIVEGQGVNKLASQRLAVGKHVVGKVYDPVPPVLPGEKLYIVLEDGRRLNFWINDIISGSIRYLPGSTFFS